MDDSSGNYVYLKTDCGFGCFLKMLEVGFIFCKTNGADLVVDLRDSPYFNDSSVNAFEVFFKSIRSKKPVLITNTDAIDGLMAKHKYGISGDKQFTSFLDPNKKGGLWEGKEKAFRRALLQISKGNGISRRIMPSSAVLDNINKYKSIFFQPDKYIIGLHVRLGNKEHNWPTRERLTLREKSYIFNTLDKYLSSLTKLQRRVGIFVCSDTESVVEEVKNRYNNVICTSRYYLDKGAGAHIGQGGLNKSVKAEAIKKMSRYGLAKIGVEALTDLFLLRDCDIIIRTPSSFSDVAKNSGVPCIEVVKP